MNEHIHKSGEDKSKSVAEEQANQSDAVQETSFADNRPEAAAQRKMQSQANSSPQAQKAAQLKAVANPQPTVQRMSGVVQRLTEGQQGLLDRFAEQLEASAAAALAVLAESPSMEDFRAIVNEMSKAQVDKLMRDSLADNGFGLKPEVSEYAEWFGEVRNERVASGAEAMEGKLNWIKGGAEGSQGNVVPKSTGSDAQGQVHPNHFARWLRGMGPEPGDHSNMNCWEACLLAGYKAGAIPNWVLGSIHRIATSDGQKHYDEGNFDSIIPAYTSAIAAVLGSGEETWNNGDDPPPRGYFVFFNGPTHVAISRGVLGDDDTPSVMSLWSRPGPNPAVMSTTIGALQQAGGPYTVTFGPAPF